MREKPAFSMKRIWLTVLKVFLLVFVAAMVVIQIPELRYDLGTKTPVAVADPGELDAKALNGSVFASVKGKPNFEQAFVYQRYGLGYTYFILEPYGLRMVVRTFEKVTEDWRNIDTYVGRLRSFDDQPFSYRIEEIFRDKYGKAVPEDSYFLALYDAPALNAWQIGAVIVATVSWGAMLYLFFFHRPKRRSAPVDLAGPYPEQDGKGLKRAQ